MWWSWLPRPSSPCRVGDVTARWGGCSRHRARYGAWGAGAGVGGPSPGRAPREMWPTSKSSDIVACPPTGAPSSSAPISSARSSPTPHRAASCCSTRHATLSSSTMSSTRHAARAGARGASSRVRRGRGRGLSELNVTIGGAGVGQTGELGGGGMTELD
jgi:hypothetical protein